VGGKERFHDEKDAWLVAGLTHSRTLTVEDTGTRHQGKNGYVTHIGNEVFAWFASTESKSRINFLPLLRAPHTDYRTHEEALGYMRQQGLPQRPLEYLRSHERKHFADPAQWTQHLTDLGITQERHRRRPPG
jgi:hypothetical protein